MGEKTPPSFEKSSSITEDFNLELQYRRSFLDVWKEEKDDPVLGPLSERMNVRGRGRGPLSVSEEEMEAAGTSFFFFFRLSLSFVPCKLPLSASFDSSSSSSSSTVLTTCSTCVAVTYPTGFYTAFCFYKV